MRKLILLVFLAGCGPEFLYNSVPILGGSYKVSCHKQRKCFEIADKMCGARGFETIWQSLNQVKPWEFILYFHCNKDEKNET